MVSFRLYRGTQTQPEQTGTDIRAHSPRRSQCSCGLCTCCCRETWSSGQDKLFNESLDFNTVKKCNLQVCHCHLCWWQCLGALKIQLNRDKSLKIFPWHWHGKLGLMLSLRLNILPKRPGVMQQVPTAVCSACSLRGAETHSCMESNSREGPCEWFHLITECRSKHISQDRVQRQKILPCSHDATTVTEKQSSACTEFYSIQTKWFLNLVCFYTVIIWSSKNSTYNTINTLYW